MKKGKKERKPGISRTNPKLYLFLKVVVPIILFIVAFTIAFLIEVL